VHDDRHPSLVTCAREPARAPLPRAWRYLSHRSHVSQWYPKGVDGWAARERQPWCHCSAVRTVMVADCEPDAGRAPCTTLGDLWREPAGYAMEPFESHLAHIPVLSSSAWRRRVDVGRGGRSDLLEADWLPTAAPCIAAISSRCLHKLRDFTRLRKIDHDSHACLKPGGISLHLDLLDAPPLSCSGAIWPWRQHAVSV
jgi:hypothetical protein